MTKVQLTFSKPM